MAQEKEKNADPLEILGEMKVLRKSLMFEWKRSNLAGALSYLDLIVGKADKLFEILQTTKNN